MNLPLLIWLLLKKGLNFDFYKKTINNNDPFYTSPSLKNKRNPTVAKFLHSLEEPNIVSVYTSPQKPN
jgi:hypothetical protein